MCWGWASCLWILEIFQSQLLNPINAIIFYQVWADAVSHLIETKKVDEEQFMRKAELREILLERYSHGRIKEKYMKSIILKDENEVINHFFKTIKGQSIYFMDESQWLKKRPPFAFGYEKISIE